MNNALFLKIKSNDKDIKNLAEETIFTEEKCSTYFSQIDFNTREYTEKISNYIKSVLDEESKVNERNLNNQHLGKFKKFINNKISSKVNINFLFGNGISNFAGSKTTSLDEIKNKLFDISYIRNKHKCDKNCYEIVEEFINSIFDKGTVNNIELLFNQLKELVNFFKIFHLNCYEILNAEIFTNNNSLLYFWLNMALGEINYNKNYFIWVFLNKIFYMNDKKINIFTLNYDLLMEKTADDGDINLINGFSGIINRKFNLEEFYMTKRLKDPITKSSKSLRGINLIKLHGSISWREDTIKNSIIEKQAIFENGKIKEQSKYFEDSNLSLIFPNKDKTSTSLISPFSELIRLFDSEITFSNNLLIIFGYSGGDEHINSLISKALKNPNFELLIFSYNEFNENFKFFEEEINKNKNITIVYSNLLSDFNFFVKEILINNEANSEIERFFSSLKEEISDEVVSQITETGKLKHEK